MTDFEFSERLITDEGIIKKIEDTTHDYYKKIFNWVRLIEVYQYQLKESENNSSIYKDKNYQPDEIVEKLESPNLLKTKIKDLVLQINHTHEKLYDFADEYNYFWCYSSLKTYSFYFEVFYRNFKRITKEVDRIDFFNYEINYFSELKSNEFIIKEDIKTNFIHRTKFIDNFAFIDYYPLLFDTNKLKIKIQTNKIIDFLKLEVENNKNATNNKTESEFLHKYINVFQDVNSSKLFKYLDENYNPRETKTKYIHLYFYLIDMSNILICTQLEYIQFIKDYKDIHISKITPKTYKYEEQVVPKLKNLSALFF